MEFSNVLEIRVGPQVPVRWTFQLSLESWVVRCGMLHVLPLKRSWQSLNKPVAQTSGWVKVSVNLTAPVTVECGGELVAAARSRASRRVGALAGGAAISSIRPVPIRSWPALRSSMNCKLPLLALLQRGSTRIVACEVSPRCCRCPSAAHATATTLSLRN